MHYLLALRRGFAEGFRGGVSQRGFAEGFRGGVSQRGFAEGFHARASDGVGAGPPGSRPLTGPPLLRIPPPTVLHEVPKWGAGGEREGSASERKGSGGERKRAEASGRGEGATGSERKG